MEKDLEDALDAYYKLDDKNKLKFDLLVRYRKRKEFDPDVKVKGYSTRSSRKKGKALKKKNMSGHMSLVLKPKSLINFGPPPFKDKNDENDTSED